MDPYKQSRRDAGQQQWYTRIQALERVRMWEKMPCLIWNLAICLATEDQSLETKKKNWSVLTRDAISTTENHLIGVCSLESQEWVHGSLVGPAVSSQDIILMLGWLTGGLLSRPQHEVPSCHQTRGPLRCLAPTRELPRVGNHIEKLY